ncbi:MAG TPA: hypothetical protein VNN10_12430, partial [Dehalococcoidia bacterium]|nr:hypothetical protein [Dehalococcoidia bacterium]
APPAPPPEVTLTFNFLGSPNLVFVCWVPSGQDANFTDVKTVIREGEQVREEVRYGVKESDCGGAAGASLYMWQPGFYHYAVRACNNAGCSQWRDAYDDARYWFTIPCADASGAACARRR